MQRTFSRKINWRPCEKISSHMHYSITCCPACPCARGKHGQHTGPLWFIARIRSRLVKPSADLWVDYWHCRPPRRFSPAQHPHSQSRPAHRFFCTGIVWATAHYGQHAYNHLYMDLDPEAKKWADIHMDRAESFQWAFYATAVLSIIALIVPKVARPHSTSTVPEKTPPGQPLSTSNEPRNVPTTRRKLTTIGSASAAIVLICATICFGLGSWISKAGGRIRHPEFREGPAPTNTPATPDHHHD